MFNFTAQHILIMRLITQFEIRLPSVLHNFIFLASADSLDFHDIGFYDFIKTRNGTYSPTVQSILEELLLGKMLNKEPLALTTKGLDTYCSLSSALRPFEDYVHRCFIIYMRYKDNLDSVNDALKVHILYYKVKQGKKLFMG